MFVMERRGKTIAIFVGVAAVVLAGVGWRYWQDIYLRLYPEELLIGTWETGEGELIFRYRFYEDGRLTLQTITQYAGKKTSGEEAECRFEVDSGSLRIEFSSRERPLQQEFSFTSRNTLVLKGRRLYRFHRVPSEG